VDGAIEVRDCGSRNGTFLDGQLVTRSLASRGSLLRVGDTLLRIARLTQAWHPAAVEGPLCGGNAMAPVRRLISLVARTELPVLILGETGTGKEVAARLMHSSSARTGPLIAVNCAALADALVDTELFGHVGGAFTGAARGRKGLFAAAAGGTLFLDEVGELPLATQAKLLRVLEDGLVRPVGSESSYHVDVRILSATNRDLGRAVADGHFRADLLARLAAVEIRMPPLHDHVEDLPQICEYLLGRRGHLGTTVHPDALEALALYPWPQNVRELDGVLRAAVLTDPSRIQLEHLPDRIRACVRRAPAEPFSLHGNQTPRDRFEAALRAHGGNVRRASQALGIARGHAYRLLRRWNIELASFRERRHRTC
jgi:DNA-binding NtrC family response regulator